jgi:hypothetical protein
MHINNTQPSVLPADAQTILHLQFWMTNNSKAQEWKAESRVLHLHSEQPHSWQHEEGRLVSSREASFHIYLESLPPVFVI